MKKFVLLICIMFSAFTFAAVNYDDFLGYWTNGMDWVYKISKDNKNDYYIQNVEFDIRKLSKWEIAHLGQFSVVTTGDDLIITPKEKMNKINDGFKEKNNVWTLVKAKEPEEMFIFDSDEVKKGEIVLSNGDGNYFRRLTKEENKKFNKIKKTELSVKEYQKYLKY